MNDIACDFCGKKQHEVEKLIAGPGRPSKGRSRCVYICNECVAFAMQTLQDPGHEEVVLVSPELTIKKVIR